METTHAELTNKELANWTGVAPGWKKNDAQQRQTFAPITERLLDRAGVGPGARVLDVACGCWAAPERNPWASIPMASVRRRANPPPPPPGAPGMFAFADPSRLQATLENAGFHDVSVEEVAVRATDFASGAEHFQWTCGMAGPVTVLYAQLARAAHEEVAREVAGELEARSAVPGRSAFDGVTWIASGRP